MKYLSPARSLKTIGRYPGGGLMNNNGLPLMAFGIKNILLDTRSLKP